MKSVPNKFKNINNIERYFNFEPSLKLRWCRARDLFGSQIPATTRGFEPRLCMQEICGSNPPVVAGICDPNKFRVRHHRINNIEDFKKHIQDWKPTTCSCKLCL